MSDGYPEGWYDDPLGRHERRYYDGGQWTDFVSNGSEVSRDPIAPAGDDRTPTADAAGADTVVYDDSTTTDTAAESAAERVAGDAGAGDHGAGDPTPAASDSVEPPRWQDGAAAGLTGGAAQDATVAVPPGTTGAVGAVGAVGAAGAVGAVGEGPGGVGSGGSGGGGGIGGFLDGLGPDARRRPRPDLATALGGLGGVFAGAGIVTLVGQSGDRGPITIGGVVAIAVAYAAALLGRDRARWLRGPAVGCAVVGLLAFSFGVAFDFDDFADIDTAFSLSLLLAGALHVACWALPGLRGRPALLGLGLIAIAFGITGLVTGDGDGGSGGLFGISPEDVGLSSSAGILLSLFGVALLLLVRWLDRNGFAGVATAVAGASIIVMISGAFILASDLGDTGGAVVITATGVIVGLIGHLGGRRALTWTGALLAGFGTLNVVFFQVEPSSAGATGALLLATGAIVAGVPQLVRLIASQQDTDAPSPDPSVPIG